MSHVEFGKVEPGSTKISKAEINCIEIGSTEPSFAKVCKTKIGITQIDIHEVRPIKISFIEIRLEALAHLCVLPGIPGLYSLFEYIEMLLVCHKLTSCKEALSSSSVFSIIFHALINVGSFGTHNICWSELASPISSLLLSRSSNLPSSQLAPIH